MEVQFDFRIFEMCKTTYIIFHRFTICQKALAKQRIVSFRCFVILNFYPQNDSKNRVYNRETNDDRSR